MRLVLKAVRLRPGAVAPGPGSANSSIQVPSRSEGPGACWDTAADAVASHAATMTTLVTMTPSAKRRCRALAALAPGQISAAVARSAGLASACPGALLGVAHGRLPSRAIERDGLLGFLAGQPLGLAVADLPDHFDRVNPSRLHGSPPLAARGCPMRDAPILR